MSGGPVVRPRPANINQDAFLLDGSGGANLNLPDNSPFHGATLAKQNGVWVENAWGMVIPGLPLLPRLTAKEHPERCLTWFLGHPLWKAYVDRIITAACVRGFTHMTLSWPDARSGWGMSMQDFVGLCAYVKSWGLKVHVKWWSKDWDPGNQTWATWGNNGVRPILNALISAHAVDAVSPWEFDSNNIAGAGGQTLVDGVLSICVPAGVECYMHFSPHVTWWGATDFLPNRDQYWFYQASKGMKGIHYQSMPVPPFPGGWDAGMKQARYQDTTNRPAFAQTGCTFIAWESDASLFFTADDPIESVAAGHAYVDLCTPGLVPVSGSGQGPRNPDGSALLS